MIYQVTVSIRNIPLQLLEKLLLQVLVYQIVTMNQKLLSQGQQPHLLDCLVTSKKHTIQQPLFLTIVKHNMHAAVNVTGRVQGRGAYLTQHDLVILVHSVSNRTILNFWAL